MNILKSIKKLLKEYRNILYNSFLFLFNFSFLIRNICNTIQLDSSDTIFIGVIFFSIIVHLCMCIILFPYTGYTFKNRSFIILYGINLIVINSLFCKNIKTYYEYFKIKNNLSRKRLSNKEIIVFENENERKYLENFLYDNNLINNDNYYNDISYDDVYFRIFNYYVIEKNRSDILLIPCIYNSNNDDTINYKFSKVHSTDSFIKEYSKKFKKPQIIEWI